MNDLFETYFVMKVLYFLKLNNQIFIIPLIFKQFYELIDRNISQVVN